MGCHRKLGAVECRDIVYRHTFWCRHVSSGSSNARLILHIDEGTDNHCRIETACAACLTSQAVEAGQLLMQVMMCGACTAEGIASDEDLRGLPPQAWVG